MTGFPSFVEAIDTQVCSAEGLRERVLNVRSALRAALTDEGFVLDCVERVTRTMAPQRAAWLNPPIHSDPALDYSIRVIYWPPGYHNNPHEHLSWTVTGVIHNRLDIHLYRWNGQQNRSDLVVDRIVGGTAGQVGYVLPPCIHSVSNPTDSVSVSLHVFSGAWSDGDIVEDHEPGPTIWYPSPRRGEILRGMRRRAMLAHVVMLASIGGARALALLVETFELGDQGVKLACVKAMTRIDPVTAGAHLRELAAISQEPAKTDLSRLSDRMLAATRRE